MYSYPKAKRTYTEARKAVRSGHTVGTTCVVPVKWGLKMMDLNPDGFWGCRGILVGFNSSLQKKMKKIKKGSVIGKTLKSAVNKGLLKTGDIIAFKGCTHTVIYSGQGYKVYEGGHLPLKNKFKTGILMDYSEGYYKNKKINQICRWK